VFIVGYRHQEMPPTNKSHNLPEKHNYILICVIFWKIGVIRYDEHYTREVI